MMKLRTILIYAAMCMLPLQHAFCAPIENVQVQISDVNGGTSEVLLSKMASSMQIVAEQLFVDKDTEAVQAAHADYAHLLAEIGDRVFAGYELKNVNLAVGATTAVQIAVQPWNAIIEKPEVDLQFSGVEPETAEILAARLPQLRQQLERTLTGASVDAGDWAGGVLRKLVRDEVERELPEFKAAVDTLSENGTTLVQVIIYPVGQLVTSTKYELRSESIPNLLLMEIKYKYLAEANKLRGLPVAYVQKHKAELEQRLIEKLMAEQEIKNYNLQPAVELVPGTALGVNIMLNSNEYKIWLEGYGDIGRDKDNLSGKAHLGKFISQQDEIFGEAEVILDDVQWNFGAGYTHYWGKSAWTYMHRMPRNANNYKLEYRLSPKWALRAEHYSDSNRNEYGVRYRIHEFLSAEYVYGGDEFYLRVIGNL